MLRIPNQPPKKQRLNKIKTILGIDEVGRGPWAGPLVIGAVILGKPHPEWENLTDSKKLSSKKREYLSQVILNNATVTGLGWVSSHELDHYGLSNALKLAARRAVKQILITKTPFDEIIIDGTVNFLQDTPLAHHVTVLKKADFLVKEVSAASIIAKVARDHYMTKISQTYPEYNFANNVGYGTAAHRQALLDFGICPEHRQSFRPIREIIIKTAPHNIPNDTQDIRETQNIQADQTESTISPPSISTISLSSTAKGQTAELIVAHYLESLGHQVIAHNFKTKTCEIDLISVHDNSIYFTEVKYRKSSNAGTPLEQITSTKQRQMQYAAQLFLAQHPEFTALQPQLAAGTVAGKTFHFEDWLIIN